ncbi:MAG: hypothetical protein U0837_14265 [Dehalococcoidia bacterium]
MREILLTRLGLFGLRFAVDAIADRRCDTAVALSRALTEISGITALRDLIDEYFVSRSQRLKARSALLQLSALARVAEEFDARVGRLITQTVETLASTAHELAELRLLHLALTGAAGLDEAELAAIRDIVSEKPLPGRLGLAADASADEQRTAALRWVAHWRERGASPVISRDLATASEIADVRTKAYTPPSGTEPASSGPGRRATCHPHGAPGTVKPVPEDPVERLVLSDERGMFPPPQPPQHLSALRSQGLVVPRGEGNTTFTRWLVMRLQRPASCFGSSF